MNHNDLIKINYLVHGKMVQDAFVTRGQVLFCCQEKECPMARKVARVILNFARVKISLLQNAGLSVRMHYLGLEKAQVQIFKVIFD